MTVRACLGPPGGRCPTGALTRKARCPACQAALEKARGTSTQRGYGKAHQQERAAWAPQVAAGNVRCWRCNEPIVGPFDLGHDDDDRTLYRGPEHPACNRATSGRTTTPAATTPAATTTTVTVICGPPCAGKTTWVREHAQPGDLIVDYDDIARRLGSRRDHDHHPRFHKPVAAVIARAVRGIQAGRHQRAWVIRSDTNRARILAHDLGAELVILNPPDQVLLARARSRANPYATIQAIKAWRKANMTNLERVYRDAGTGEYVTAEYAAANPDTTVSEPAHDDGPDDDTDQPTT